MSHLPQKSQQPTTLPSVTLSPQKMAIARNLSQDMAVIQANELLAQDILNKIANLSELENQILARNSQAVERTNFVIKAFAYKAVQRFK